MGFHSTKQAADEEAAADRARGAAGYVPSGNGFSVLAAAYGSRSDAQKVQTQLRSSHQVETAVVDIVRPEITLRLTGQQAQLTALTDACTLMDQLAESCASLSQGLDGRTLSAIRQGNPCNPSRPPWRPLKAAWRRCSAPMRPRRCRR